MKKMRDLLFMTVMAAAMILTQLPVKAEEAATVKIGTAREFMNFIRQCDYDAWSLGKEFELTDDISLSEETDFRGGAVFAGTLKGNGHTVSGITLENEQTPAGLFATVTKDGAIDNLKVSATITPKGSQVSIGGIAGINYGIIRNCSFMGTVKGARNTGGIAGINAGTGMILSCTASGVIYGETATGGITGYNLGTVTNSENSAYVNTDADEKEINVSDLSFGLSPDTDSFLASRSTVVRMDTGGIAGYSDGSIILCRNLGTVGYPQIGYNAGGIAGRSDGHIMRCMNNASVYGRKDVGGIAGQAEPYVTANLSASTVSVLSGELSVLQYGISSLQSHAEDAQNELRDRADRMKEYSDEAQDALNKLADNNTDMREAVDTEAVESRIRDIESFDLSSLPDSIDFDLDDIRSKTDSFREKAYNEIDVLQEINLKNAGGELISSLSGLYDQAGVLRQEVSGRIDALADDANSITASITSMENTLSNALYELQHPENFIQDTSDSNVEAVILGKISSCTNRGEVSGDLNVGGIAGAMGLEYTQDPEEDISGELDGSTKRQYELKCILENNVNEGAVKSVRNDTGGITGRMDLGLIMRCESYGDVSSSSGDEVGGIAGIAAATVRNNYAKCRLSGASAVGGIVGAGTAGTLNGSSSVVDSNVSMVDIIEAGESYGAISGTDTGTFSGNVFVSDDLAGINSASFSGRAEPVSYQELVDSYHVPEAFRYFTLRFMADEEVLKEIRFSYGDSFKKEDMPEIPVREGMYAYYDNTDLSDLHKDTVVNAVYENDLTALSGKESRSSGRSVFYVKGKFDKDSDFKVSYEAHDTAAFDLARVSLWRAVAGYLRSPGQGLAYDVLEQWHIEIPSDGEESHEVRYLLPETHGTTLQIYLRTDGAWTRVTPQKIGSYAVLDIAGNSADLAVITTIPGWWIYVLLGNLAVIIAIAIALYKSRAKRRKTAQALRSRIAVDRRLQIAAAAAGVAAVALIATGAWFLHSVASGGARAYQLIREYTDAKPVAMEGSLNLSAGSDSLEENFMIRQSEDGITVITMNDLSLYYSEKTVYLENGRAFEIGSLIPDYGSLLDLTCEIFEHGTIQVSSEDDATVYTLSASQDDAEALLKILLAEYADELPDLKTVSVEMRQRGEKLDSISFKAAGVLKDSDKTAYDLSAVLTVRDPSVSPMAVPEAVQQAIREKKPAEDVLSRDYLDLLRALASLRRSDTMSARVRINAEADALSFSDTLQYRRTYNEGSPVRSIQKGDLVVYFNDQKMCNENGLTVTDPARRRLVHTGRLPELIYAICMNGTFDVSTAAERRVFTITLDEASLKEVASAVLSDHLSFSPELTGGTVLVTLNNDSIDRVNCTLTGSVTVLEAEVPVSIGTEATIDTDTAFSVPDKVLSALEE